MSTENPIHLNGGLTSKEFVNKVGVTLGQLPRLLRESGIKCKRFGRLRVFDPVDIERARKFADRLDMRLFFSFRVTA
jgi:hypothetical protein